MYRSFCTWRMWRNIFGVAVVSKVFNPDIIYGFIFNFVFRISFQWVHFCSCGSQHFKNKLLLWGHRMNCLQALINNKCSLIQLFFTVLRRFPVFFPKYLNCKKQSTWTEKMKFLWLSPNWLLQNVFFILFSIKHVGQLSFATKSHHCEPDDKWRHSTIFVLLFCGFSVSRHYYDSVVCQLRHVWLRSGSLTFQRLIYKVAYTS